MLTLKEWRRAKNISQESMAEWLGIHVNTYRSWEDKPSEIKLGYAVKIAAILDLEMTDIKFLP